METQVCIKCNKEYPLENFQVRESGKRRTECKECQNSYQRMRYLEKQGKFKRDVRAETRESDPKTCIKCGVEKPLSEYTFHNRNKGQHRNFCHECEKAWIRDYHKSPQGKEKQKEWIGQNKEKIEEYKRVYRNDTVRRERSKAYHRARFLRESFNMTVDDYMVMFQEQDGKCAICGSETISNGNRKNFCVDHDHATGRVRGLLCHNCNVSVGLMKDSPSLLRKAATYLESFKQ
jgi:hypothetical protein